MEFTAEGLVKLEELRELYDSPMKINSGYRCPLHPIERAKAAGPGAHSIVTDNNITIDTAVYGKRAWGLIWIAMSMGWTGIGLDQKSSTPHKERYIHLDRLPNSTRFPRPWPWTY